MRLFSWLKKKGGFTVLEMLVVLGISAVLSSLFVGYGSNLKNQIALFREEAKLIQTIYKAKTFSLQVRAGAGEAAACAYGVHVEQSTGEYFVYKKDKLFNGCGELSIYEYRGGDEVIGSRERLPGQITVEREGITDVAFIPPKPEVKLTPQPVGQREGSVKLCTGEGVAIFCRTVTINSVGQINSGKVK